MYSHLLRKSNVLNTSPIFLLTMNAQSFSAKKFKSYLKRRPSICSNNFDSQLMAPSLRRIEKRRRIIHYNLSRRDIACSFEIALSIREIFTRYHHMSIIRRVSGLGNSKYIAGAVRAFKKNNCTIPFCPQQILRSVCRTMIFIVEGSI